MNDFYQNIWTIMIMNIKPQTYRIYTQEQRKNMVSPLILRFWSNHIYH